MVGGSDYAKIAEQLGDGDEGEMRPTMFPRGGLQCPKSAPRRALGAAGRAPAGVAAPRFLPLRSAGGAGRQGRQAGMLQPTLPAPASALYELRLGSDSFPLSPPPPRSGLEPLANFASLLLHAGGSEGVPHGVQTGTWGKELEGEGASSAPSTLFSFSGMDAKHSRALSSASVMEGDSEIPG